MGARGALAPPQDRPRNSSHRRERGLGAPGPGGCGRGGEGCGVRGRGAKVGGWEQQKVNEIPNPYSKEFGGLISSFWGAEAPCALALGAQSE
jgi:hypothetical protein